MIMAFEYSETIAPDGDAEGKVLSTLADGELYVFVVCKIDEDGALNLRVASEHGADTIRGILQKTLAALP
jgi:hypothetical protein